MRASGASAPALASLRNCLRGMFMTITPKPLRARFLSWSVELDIQYSAANKFDRSKPARSEHFYAELLLHRAAEAIFHFGSFVVRGRSALVVGFGLDTQADEIG